MTARKPARHKRGVDKLNAGRGVCEDAARVRTRKERSYGLGLETEDCGSII